MGRSMHQPESPGVESEIRSVSARSQPTGLPGAESLELIAFEEAGSHVMEGLFARWQRTAHGFRSTRGVPSFLTGPLRPDLRDFCERYGLERPDDAEGQIECNTAGQDGPRQFSDKWRRFRSYGLETGTSGFPDGLVTARNSALRDRSDLAAFLYIAIATACWRWGRAPGFQHSVYCRAVAVAEVYALDISDAAFTTFENTRDLPKLHRCSGGSHGGAVPRWAFFRSDHR